MASRASAASRRNLRSPTTSLAYKDVRHAAAHQGFRLADLLDALTDGTLRDLPQRDGNRRVLACGRTRTPVARANSAIFAMLRSNASRSTTSAGVSMSSTGAPISAGRQVHRSHPNMCGAHMTTSSQMQRIAIMISSAIMNGAEPSSTSESFAAANALDDEQVDAEGWRDHRGLDEQHDEDAVPHGIIACMHHERRRDWCRRYHHRQFFRGAEHEIKRDHEHEDPYR